MIYLKQVLNKLNIYYKNKKICIIYIEILNKARIENPLHGPIFKQLDTGNHDHAYIMKYIYKSVFCRLKLLFTWDFAPWDQSKGDSVTHRTK